MSVNYVGLDTFNRRLAPGQSGEKDRFSMTNLHYTEEPRPGPECQGGATQTRVLAIQGNRHQDCYEVIMRARGGSILKLKTVIQRVVIITSEVNIPNTYWP